MFAGTKNGEHPIGARDRRTTSAGRTLVAGHGGVAEVHAACPLDQVAGGCGHVAQLCRSSSKDCLGKYGVIALDCRVVSELGISHCCADTQSAVSRRLYLIERQTVDVDYVCRCFHVELHQIE